MFLPLVLAIVTVAQAPPLPELALATYPAAAREMLSRAHAAAVERPDDAAAAGAFGRALQAWEQWEAAHQAYARAQALDAAAFEWHYLDAMVLQRMARHADAAARLKVAVKTNPAYLPARMKLAESLLESGQFRESEGMFKVLLAEAAVPAVEPLAHMGLGRIAAIEGDRDRAIRHFERAAALFPELGAAHYALARLYRSAGRKADAADALERHARYGPRWPGLEDPVLASVSSLRDDARALLVRGLASAADGQVEQAIASHETALKLDPSLSQAHANLLSLYGRAQNWAKAEEHYHAAVKKGVTTADLHYDYGVVLGLQEKWDAAAEAYRRAIAVNPLHAQARNNLGQLLERRRDYDGAAAEYRRAVEAQPAFRLARFNLGRMLLVADRPAEAITEFEKLIHPRDAEAPRYLFALSTACVRAGRLDEGRKWAVDARQLAIEHGQADLAAAIDRELARLK